MSPVCHVSGADEWLDGALGGRGMQEARQKGGEEGKNVWMCAGQYKGVEKEDRKFGN